MYARSTPRLLGACLSVLALLATGTGSPVGTQVPAAAAAASRVDFAWQATIGAGGADGSATVSAYDTARGAVALSLRLLTPSARYAVVIRRGACGSLGTRVVAVGTFSATASGTLSATVPLTVAQVTAIRDAAVGLSRVSLVAGTGSKARCGTLAKSLAVTPQVWFGPLPSWDGLGYTGVTDYKALFGSDATWARVAGRTHVFTYWWQWIVLPGGATDAELRREVAALKARDIAIGIDYEPLVSDTCGAEGFGAGGVPTALAAIRRIAAAGGTVRYIRLDEPLAGAVVYDGETACHWTVEETAPKVADFVRGVKAVYPSIIIGDIEPWPAVSTEMLGRWLDAYEAAAGSPFPLLHLDMDWSGLASDWPSAAREIEQLVRNRGTRFGIIYNGFYETSDAAWLAHAQANVLAYEIDGGGPPDDAVFMSWTDKPDRALPETGPSTFTHFIADYARTRTTVSVAATPATSGGTITVTGTVRTLGGDPVAGGTVAVSAVPRDGPYQVIELQGTVPAGQSRALIGIRTNTEGAGPGSADVTFYEIGYAEGTETTNRVPNGGFDDGAWDYMGDATFTVGPSDSGTGSMMLRIVATPTQWVMSNSAEFSVTAGAQYRTWVAVRVPEASIGSTAVDLIFLGSGEIESTRVRLHLASPAPIPAGSATVDATGAFSLTTSALDAGRYWLAATYAGNPTYWPARQRTEVTVP